MVFVILSVSQVTLWYMTETTSSSFMILLDAGGSMNALDVEQTRLNLAKTFSTRLLDNVSARIGFLSFAGTILESQNPTFEKEDIKYLIGSTEISQSGTDIGLALVSGIDKVTSDESEEDATIGTLILVSDGHDTVGIPLSEAIKKAVENHVQIITVGVGTLEGGSFITGPTSAGIISKLNEENLKLIANSTNSNYYNLKNEAGIDSILSDISYEKKEGFVPLVTSEHLIFVIFSLLILEWVLSNTRFRILP